MIKPYYKRESNAAEVEVEEYGTIKLSELPIRVRIEKAGVYEIGWVLTIRDGKQQYVLSESGGRDAFSFGGKELGVVREIKKARGVVEDESYTFN